MDGPSTEFTHDQHVAFHRYLDLVEDGKYSRHNVEAAKNFAQLTTTQRAAILREAAAVAGFTSHEVDDILKDAFANSFSPGSNNAAEYRKYTRIVDIAADEESLWKPGRTAAEFADNIAGSGRSIPRSRLAKFFGKALKGGGKAVPVLGLALTAQTLFEAGSNPYVWDIARTTRKLRRTGEIEMIDEAFILYDLYQITNDYIGANVGYTTWLEMNGLDY